MATRVLICGASGFIGRELLTGSGIPATWEVRTANSVESILSQGNWARGCVYIHLAGRFFGTNDELWAANVTLTRDCLAAVRAIGGERVIFLSTGAVYGRTMHETGSTEEDPTEPVNFYGFSKLVAELLIKHEWGSYGCTFLIMRLPNVYGANQKKGVLFEFSRQIREEQTIRIAGDGEQRRDFLHISDLISALHSAVEKIAISGCFNISSKLTLTVNQVASILASEKVIPRTYIPDSNGLRSLVLDFSKAKKLLGYEPIQNELLR